MALIGNGVLLQVSKGAEMKYDSSKTCRPTGYRADTQWQAD